MPTDNGYSNQKKKGLAQFETVHNLGSSAYGKVIAPKSLYEITASAAIVSVTDIKGSNGLVEYWNIELTAHGASVGNVLRIDAGSLINTEYEIIQVIDVDNFYILPITDVKPAPADTGVIMGWVTQKLASDGSINVAITSAPTSFNLDGVPQTVEQDTVTPANNKALPNLNFIIKDGVQVPVTKDTGLPSNTVGMPVELVAASGTPINITAGDLNVQLSDQGVNYDSTRIGDGTNLLGITASNEAKVSDADALVELQALVAKDFSTLAEQQVQTSHLNDIENLVGGVVATETTIENNSFTPGDIRRPYFNPEGMFIVRDIYTQQEVASVVTNLATLTGRFPASLGRKDETLSLAVVLSDQDALDLSSIASSAQSLETQLPATLGQKTGANSLAVIPASDYIPPSSAVPAAVTVKNATITVGITPVRATTDGAAPSATRRKLRIFVDPDTVTAGTQFYLGGSTVANSGGTKGEQIYPGSAFVTDNDANDYYLIATLAGQPVSIVECE